VHQLCRGVRRPFDKESDSTIINSSCPRGGIGIHGRLRACARMGVPVRVGPGAFVTLPLPSLLQSCRSRVSISLAAPVPRFDALETDASSFRPQVAANHPRNVAGEPGWWLLWRYRALGDIITATIFGQNLRRSLSRKYLSWKLPWPVFAKHPCGADRARARSDAGPEQNGLSARR
jgi:hypothetical protein